jgi:alcohol dehydrogenase class IV
MGNPTLSEPMRFEFATVTRLQFGAGAAQDLGSTLKTWGQHALVVTGRNTARSSSVIALLQSAGVEVTPFSVAREPTVDSVREGSNLAREHQCDMVVALGGGSAIDAGKAIAAMAVHEGDLLNYLEVIGKGQALSRPGLPWVAIPTTAGTGAEVTRNAVIGSPEHGVKVSLRSPFMLARLAVVDPELTLSVPPAITATTGLDALTQLIEALVSPRANPMTDGFCREGILRVKRSLKTAFQQGGDLVARTDMSLASLLGGLALANAGLGAVHGFAGPLGGLINAPHGAVCAALLPHVMIANWRALLSRNSHHPACQRYEEIGRLLTGLPTASAENGLEWIQELCATCNIPGLSAYGFQAEQIEALLPKAMAANSMKGNPVELTKRELRQVLQRAL